MPRPKSQNMRQRILDAAAAKFFRVGFFRVSLDSIVTDLRTSKSSIYKYFGSKEEMVETLMNNINNEIDTNLKIILSKKELSFKETLTEITKFTAKLFERVSQEFLTDLRIHTPDIWNEYQKRRKARIEKFYNKLLTKGMKEGILRKDLPADFLLLVYSKLTDIVVNPRQIQDLSFKSTDAYEWISSIFLEGTLTEKGRKIN
jgi:AcrR family transcriptional regulator